MLASEPAPPADRLAALEARIARQEAAQHAEVAALRGELAALRRRLARRRGAALARALAAVVVVALLATPLGALAANFTDLNNGSPHNANINAIADAGISLGCNPSGTQYCPNQLVTREQMASFLARTAGLGTNPPIANAATAQTAATATNATNAAQLGGVPASGYVRQDGELVFGYTPIAMRATSAQATLGVVGNGTLNVGATTPGNYILLLPLDVPDVLYGRALAFTSVQVCSGAGGSGTQPTITKTEVLDIANFGAASVVSDATVRAEGGCYTVADDVPSSLFGGLVLKLTLSVTDAAATFTFHRIAVTLVPAP